MMHNSTNDNNHPLRSILKRMERSIDDARHRRTRAPEPSIESNGVPAGAPMNTIHDPIGKNALDTPIVSTKQASPAQTRTGPMWDEGTMFDFDGPRLKARPKRRSAS